MAAEKLAALSEAIHIINLYGVSVNIPRNIPHPCHTLSYRWYTPWRHTNIKISKRLLIPRRAYSPLGHHQRWWWPSGEPALLGFNKTGVLTGETLLGAVTQTARRERLARAYHIHVCIYICINIKRPYNPSYTHTYLYWSILPIHIISLPSTRHTRSGWPITFGLTLIHLYIHISIYIDTDISIYRYISIYLSTVSFLSFCLSSIYIRHTYIWILITWARPRFHSQGVSR